MGVHLNAFTVFKVDDVDGVAAQDDAVCRPKASGDPSRKVNLELCGNKRLTFVGKINLFDSVKIVLSEAVHLFLI